MYTEYSAPYEEEERLETDLEHLLYLFITMGQVQNH